MNHEEYKRKALEPIVNYIESVMASYSKEELEARIKKALPELKESEDERIRKEIHAYFFNTLHNTQQLTPRTNELVRWLAYLERQKEYVSDNFDDVWTTEDCAEIIEAGEKLSPRFKELFKEVCHAWYDKGIELEKQKEQKPAEWSEEDERMLSRCIKSVECSKQFADSESYKAAKDVEMNWLNALRNRGNSSKSNANSPHWKPSEEQMKHLKTISVGWHPDSKDCQVLSSLYNDLKNL